ncbi:MAG TPA: hypothetical protein VKU92_11910 [Acidimicrobiales bacterium]|nr:hypothetical protein [Acidimicrobiales bacterium]
MSLTAHELEQLCSTSYLDGLDTAPVTELRQRRDACQRAEVILSYLRRVIQGEMDLVLAEMEQRRSGGASDIGRLVEELPTILSSGPPASGRPESEPTHVSVLAMPAVAEMMDLQHELSIDELLAEVLATDPDDVGQPGEILSGANLCTYEDDELQQALERLRDEETTVSGKRRILHEQIDAIQKAIVDRYKSGAADADSLLA